MASLNNEKAEVKAILEINSSVQTSPETLSPNQSNNNNNRSLNHTTKRDSSSSYMKQRSTENQRSESHSNAKAKKIYNNYKYLGDQVLAPLQDRNECKSPHVLYAKIYKSSESLFDQEVEEVKTMISKSIVNEEDIDLNVKNLLEEKKHREEVLQKFKVYNENK